MRYRVFTNGGYIISIQHNAENGNATEEEYQKIMDAIRNKPTAPEGHDYRLTVGLEWELYELPKAQDIDRTEEV